jgi:uncharacterized membrane protein YtjA (UPF0391 family)
MWMCRNQGHRLFDAIASQRVARADVVSFLQFERNEPKFVRERSHPMLRYALIFLVVAIIAAVFGFGGIAGEAAWIAKVLLVVFLILAVVSFIFGRKK